MDIIRRLSTWTLPGRLVVMGVQQTGEAGVTRHAPHLVSIDLKTGAVRATNVAGAE